MSSARIRTALGALVVTLGFAPVAAFAQTLSPSETPLLAAPAGSLTVSLPQNVTAKAGSEFSLPLTVSNGAGIGSFALSVIYDPAKVDYVKTEGSSDTNSFKFVDGKIDSDGGMKELILGGTSSTKITKTGPVVLATLKFTAKSTASGVLSFQLKNPTDDIASATLESGKVTVGSAAPTSTPTATPTPVPSTPTLAPTSSVPSTVSEAPSLEPDSSIAASDVASEIQAPGTLDETGPAELLGLLALSIGLAAFVHLRGATTSV